MAPADQVKVETRIREFAYTGLERIQKALAADGLTVSRSGLHRYIRQLRDADGLRAAPGQNTVVTIVERETGVVLTKATSVAGSVIAAIIEGLQTGQKLGLSPGETSFQSPSQ